MKNRLLRFKQDKRGVHHASVFYQFSGGMGPSALVVDPKTNLLYVAHYDIATGNNKEGDNDEEGNVEYGKVSVLSIESGEVVGLINGIPGPELSGLAIRNDTLYITEASTNSIFTTAVLEMVE
eukprot:TRINITY_DN1272_c0_g2_i1.p1 TRINITY_DN1272_c0_g2~~TRINITY_DN1272_c0_g2_i1.p1  ORF type:complete len:123 (+),score=30.37 TRINITY_DN1272_c0_g2_i1:378-746(+)